MLLRLPHSGALLVMVAIGAFLRWTVLRVQRAVCFELLALERAPARLPERQRLVLFLRYYADLDYRSIGEALGIAPGTVGATLNAAHAVLRQEVHR